MRLFDEHIVRDVQCLNGVWRFLVDKENVGLENGWQNGLPSGDNVIVPSAWNGEIGLLTYEGKAWYEKKFFTKGGTLRFVFEAVAAKATVWLDGKELGYHFGGFSKFEFIVNDVESGEHTLVVMANNEFTPQSIPQRRVDWFNYGGIIRDVFCERLEGICVLTNHFKYELSDDFTTATASSSIVLYNASSNETTSSLSVSIGDEVMHTSNVTVGAYQRLTLDTPSYEIKDIKLWDTKTPNLYTLCTKTDTDDLYDRVGFRKIEAKDNKILLNGKRIELRGVNRHEENPDWGFAFPPKMMKRDLDIIKDLGCNTIRGSHYPQSFIFVDMLDEAGILFWSEIPIWGCGFSEQVLGDEVVVERALEMHREMTDQYYNHPSIIIWGMHNEVYTPYPCVYPMTKRFHDHLRANGGNRLITHATLCPFDDTCYEFDDIICINLYHAWYYGSFEEWNKSVAKMREHREKLGISDKPVVYSEFGAGALYGYHTAFDTLRWSEEYQADLLEHCLELFHNDDMVSGFYIWQFCNIRTSPIHDLNRVRCFNNKGILDEYRNPKVAYHRVKKLYHKYASEENE